MTEAQLNELLTVLSSIALNLARFVDRFEDETKRGGALDLRNVASSIDILEVNR